MCDIHFECDLRVQIFLCVFIFIFSKRHNETGKKARLKHATCICLFFTLATHLVPHDLSQAVCNSQARPAAQPGRTAMAKCPKPNQNWVICQALWTLPQLLPSTVTFTDPMVTRKPESTHRSRETRGRQPDRNAATPKNYAIPVAISGVPLS